MLEVGKHYELSVKPSMRKAEITRILVEYLVGEDMLDAKVLEGLDNDDKDVVEIKRLELEYQLKIEEIKREKEREERERERERQWQIRQDQLEKEPQIREKERLRIHEEREAEERQRKEQREAEERGNALKLQHELEIPKLELKAQQGAIDIKDRPFDVGKESRLVSAFQEREVEKYFLHFEKVAQQLKWPEEYWAVLLQSRLIGKAHETYAALPVDQSTDYKSVKQVILKAYELIPEAYRQKFRNCRSQEGHTYVEFAKEKETLFDRWCISKEIDQDFGKLRQLVLIEEFKRCIAPEVRTHLDERKAEELHQAATYADDYALTHKNTLRSSKSAQRDAFKEQTDSQSVSKNVEPQVSSKKGTPGVTNPEGNEKKVSTSPKPVCGYCKKT